ncbi:hypothetical protein D3C71_1374790 [compost metagenome]
MAQEMESPIQRMMLMFYIVWLDTCKNMVIQLMISALAFGSIITMVVPLSA